MKLISFEKLYTTDFFISESLVKPQYWQGRGNVYNALGKPKISHTLLWFKNCSAVITDSMGNVLHAAQNQLIYTAKGIEYKILFQDTGKSKEDTVVIHFQMTDKDGEDIAPILTPFVCMKSLDGATAASIDMLAKEFTKNIVCVPEINSVIYKILADICKNQKRRTTKKRYARIINGIELLEQNSELDIEEIARRCGISCCYFRRLFKEYSGESPIQFRQRHRIERAKSLLLSDEPYSIGEIASELNFLDIYHFSKTFKKLCGMSPSEFLSRYGAE
jgi:AraC-like DNA-binding protein